MHDSGPSTDQGNEMATYIIQAVIWTLCVVALCISYLNYSRYIEAKRDPEKSRRSLQTALYANNDAAIGHAEFEEIESSHYRPYLKRFRVAIFLSLSFGFAGLTLLIA
ncbi:hypothetical protein SAMN03159307_02405 [Pseudomonas sp. NFACC46-3]|nr:hypothetical protein SAMN03159307_02405 [Pseudomonas sp. NFACC46-3]